ISLPKPLPRRGTRECRGFSWTLVSHRSNSMMPIEDLRMHKTRHWICAWTRPQGALPPNFSQKNPRDDSESFSRCTVMSHLPRDMHEQSCEHDRIRRSPVLVSSWTSFRRQHLPL